MPGGPPVGEVPPAGRERRGVGRGGPEAQLLAAAPPLMVADFTAPPCTPYLARIFM